MLFRCSVDVVTEMDGERGFRISFTKSGLRNLHTKSQGKKEQHGQDAPRLGTDGWRKRCPHLSRHRIVRFSCCTHHAAALRRFSRFLRTPPLCSLARQINTLFPSTMMRPSRKSTQLRPRWLLAAAALFVASRRFFTASLRLSPQTTLRSYARRTRKSHWRPRASCELCHVAQPGPEPLAVCGHAEERQIHDTRGGDRAHACEYCP